MSPQLLWTIAGLILTILTLGGITISSSQSLDSATAKMVASEVGNVAVATKLWIANSSTDGTFNGITPILMSPLIPDLAILSAKFTSKAQATANINVASTTPFNTVVITVTSPDAASFAALQTALANKACVVAGTTPATTYTCKG